MFGSTIRLEYQKLQLVCVNIRRMLPAQYCFCHGFNSAQILAIAALFPPATVA